MSNFQTYILANVQKDLLLKYTLSINTRFLLFNIARLLHSNLECLLVLLFLREDLAIATRYYDELASTFSNSYQSSLNNIFIVLNNIIVIPLLRVVI